METEGDENLLPIIQDLVAYTDYPIQAIGTTALDLFDLAKQQLPPYLARNYWVVIKTFECYLQITSQTVDASTIESSSFREISKGYIGALYSSAFVKATLNRSAQITKTFLLLVKAAKRKNRDIQLIEFKLIFLKASPEVESFVAFFNTQNLNKEKVWLWRAWKAIDKEGSVTWLPLYSIFIRLGKEFTQKLYEVLKAYFFGRRFPKLPELSHLAQFIFDYRPSLSPNDFQNPKFITQFWRGFLVYCVEAQYADGKGNRISTIVTTWRGGFRTLVIDHFVPSGLFAQSLSEFPMPPARKVYGAKTNIKKKENGTEIKTKLLTHVPLELSDEEAMNLLFGRIESDFNTLVEWANWAVEDMWARYQRRLTLAPLGKVRKISSKTGTNNGSNWETNRRNPEYLQNAAATLEHYGHFDREVNVHGRLVAKPLPKTAHELGMPVTGSLIPHCVLLISEHPAITPSFLETLELFNRDGKLVGFVELDNAHYLVSYKMRRGSAHAQQKILLNSLTLKVVRQLIELTRPLREFLKNRNDINWRYLFLTCSTGFVYPSRVKLIIETSIEVRIQALAKSLEATCSLSLEERYDLANRFSLSALRASAGVLIYLRTKSVVEMSKALGHAEYNHDLLSRYLPPAIVAFFQERWIRLFQTGIVVEALKESPYLLEASGFSSINQLHNFLSKHVIKKLPDEGQTPLEISRSKNDVVFGINSEILTLMLSLELAVQNTNEPVCAKANYWAAVSKELVTHIESHENHRDDFRQFLSTARKNASASLIKGLSLA